MHGACVCVLLIHSISKLFRKRLVVTIFYEIVFSIVFIANQAIAAGIPSKALYDLSKVGDIRNHQVVSLKGGRDQISQEPFLEGIGNW